MKTPNSAGVVNRCFCSGTSPPWGRKTRHLNSYHGNCCTGFLMLHFQPIVFLCSYLRIVLWHSHLQCSVWLLWSVFYLPTYTSGIDLIAFLFLSSLCPPFLGDQMQTKDIKWIQILWDERCSSSPLHSCEQNRDKT